jgi:light-regulated signal transduction histidine kinase (bacteriophytochrome)
LIAQEQKLVAINRNLEIEIKERKSSEEKIKDLNRELLENIARLESANKDLDRFAFMASHDLQEPLRKIRMFSDCLFSKYNDDLDENGKMYLDRIQNAAERMQDLIKDILTFSKVSTEPSAFVETNMDQLLNEVLHEMEEVLHEKKVKITTSPLPSLYVNPGLIRPLFHNLINNAIKYSRKNVEPQINVRAEMTSSSNGMNNKKINEYCRIFVEDNGIGFEQKYAEQIFDMFTRLHLNDEFEGTGIGLALCKKIVEKHNGYISARSKINEGSVFIISLPVTNPVEHILTPS